MPAVYKFQDTLADTMTGKPLRDVIISVVDHNTGLPATLYTEAGAISAAPVVTDVDGYFSFYAELSEVDIKIPGGETVKTLTDVLVGGIPGAPGPASSGYTLVSSYASLAAAVAAIGAGDVTLGMTENVTITANLTIPANIELLPLNGAVINHGAYTISYAGSTARWPLAQIFNGTGAVTLAKAAAILPEWFGAVAGGADCTDALTVQASYASQNSVAGKVIPIQLSVGVYKTSAAWTMFSYMRLLGAGMFSDEYGKQSVIENTATDVFTLAGNVIGVNIHGVTFYGDSSTSETNWVTPVDMGTGYIMRWGRISHCGFKYFNPIKARWTGMHFSENFVNMCPDGAMWIAGADNTIRDNFLNTLETTTPATTIHVVRLAYCENSVVENNYITGLKNVNSPASVNDRIPLFLDHSNNVMIRGNWFDYSNLCGVYSLASANVSLIQNNFRYNCAAPSGTYTGVIQGFDAKAWTVQGNNFVPPSVIPSGRRLFNFRKSTDTVDGIYISGNTYHPDELAVDRDHELFQEDAGFITNVYWRESPLRFNHRATMGETYTIRQSENERSYDNVGSIGTTTLVLPTATIGTQFTFARVASHALQIDPSASEIIGAAGAGKYLSLDSNGAVVTVKCFSVGVWTVTSSIGTLTYEP